MRSALKLEAQRYSWSSVEPDSVRDSTSDKPSSKLIIGTGKATCTPDDFPERQITTLQKLPLIWPMNYGRRSDGIFLVYLTDIEGAT